MPGLVPAPALAPTLTQRGRWHPNPRRGSSSEIGTGIFRQDLLPAARSHTPAAARSPSAVPLPVRGSFAKWEELGGEGAAPGTGSPRDGVCARGERCQQSPAAVPRAAAPLRRGPHRVTGTSGSTQLFWGGAQDPREPPREGTGWPQLSPTTPGEDGAKLQRRHKAHRGAQGRGRSRLAPLSHRLSVPATSPGRTERPLGARCSSPRAPGTSWGAGGGCGAVTPARGSASGVVPTPPLPPCRAPWWLGRPPPRSGRSSRPGCPCAAAP